MTRVVVVGQGYVGLPMALQIAETEMSVVGLDSNENVVSALNRGESHILDVSGPRVKAALRSGYRATADPSCIAEADVVIVCVPTPVTDDGEPDLRPVVAAAETIAKHVRSRALIILESTSYPGTTEEVFAPVILGTDPERLDNLKIAFSPERIDPGNAKFDIRNTPKVVGGLTAEGTQAAAEFYRRIVHTVVEAKGAREAEMAKLLENSFRHVNIALMNELVRYAAAIDVDLWNAIECAETKPFGFLAFRPGPGVGGHCIPVDPLYLQHKVQAVTGKRIQMINLATRINDETPIHLARKVPEILLSAGVIKDKPSVLLVGVAYKADVSDVRNTPAAPLAAELVSNGAKISFYDPLVPTWAFITEGQVHQLQSEPDLAEAAQTADVILLITPHSMIDLRQLVSAGTPVVDTRGVLESHANVIRL